jgi:hypothetical protein
MLLNFWNFIDMLISVSILYMLFLMSNKSVLVFVRVLNWLILVRDNHILLDFRSFFDMLLLNYVCILCVFILMSNLSVLVFVRVLHWLVFGRILYFFFYVCLNRNIFFGRLSFDLILNVYFICSNDIHHRLNFIRDRFNCEQLLFNLLNKISLFLDVDLG